MALSKNRQYSAQDLKLALSLVEKEHKSLYAASKATGVPWSTIKDYINRADKSLAKRGRPFASTKNLEKNTPIEDEINIKMDPDEIANTSDTDQVPNKMDTEQVPNIIDTDQVPIKMDIEQVPGEMDTAPERIEPEQVPEDLTPFDELIEELAGIKSVEDFEDSEDSITNTNSPTNHPPNTTTPTTHTHNQFIPILPKPTPHLVTDETNENITTDAEIKKLENYKKKQNDKLEAKEKDAIERIRIIQNVLNRCREMTKGGTSPEIPVPPIQRLHFFTKANPDYLAEVLQDYKPRNRSVKQAALDTMPIPSYMNNIIYNDVRDVFVEFYLEKKQVPTKKELLESLQEKGSSTSKEYYRNIKLRTLVKNKLVIYHDIPKLNRYILIENPEFAYRRNKYLRHVIKYRESGAKFIYVTAMTVDTDVGAMTLTLAASSTAGLIDQLRPVLPTAEGFSLTIKNWLAELLPSLDPTVIVVLTQPRKKDTTPTHYSTKDQMITWLINKDIPTDLDTNKYHLYQLVKRSKNNKDTGFYDEVFTSAGFKLIVNPIEYKSLNYFNAIYRECASNNIGEFDEAERMVEFMRKMSREDWMKLEEALIEEEKQMIKEDREMETMIENIFEMVKNGDVEESDFPEGCEGDRSDNFDVHIGDIIID